jgi:spermidine synthase
MVRASRNASADARSHKPDRSGKRSAAIEAAAPLTALATCLLLSGTASLMLETVWARSLRLIFGSTTLATSTVLVAYMLGLGLGGLAGGRWAARTTNGVRTYGLLEIGVGVSAALVPLVFRAFPFLNQHVLATLGFWPATLGRFAAVLCVLLPSTLLMGATLPVAVAAVRQQPAVAARAVGLLYGINTAGAVAGVFLATFVMFRAVGVTGTNLLAALLSGAIGMTAVFILARRYSAAPPAQVPASRPPPGPLLGNEVGGARGDTLPRWSPAVVSYAAVGCTALLYEVCWTRALTLVLGSSVYAFAAMLAAFLAGIAAGSLAVRRWLVRLRRPEVVYAAGVGLLGVLAYVTSLSFSALPDFFIGILRALGVSEGGMVAANLGVGITSMLGPTVVLGALFPLLAQAGAGRVPLGSLVGDIYFLNTVGSAAGAFGAGFLLIPYLGLPRTMALGVAADLGMAAVLLAWMSSPSLPSRGPGGGSAQHAASTVATRFVAPATAVVLALLALIFPPYWNPQALTRGVYTTPRELIASNITLLPLEGMPDEALLFYRDGLNATVSVHRMGGDTSLRVNGKGEASTGKEMSTQVLTGHIPMLFGGRAERVLVIGLASGVTAGSAALHRPAQLDIVEIEPAIIEASHFFDAYNNQPLAQPFVRVIDDDARSYMASTAQRYDVIISVPSNPWTSGSAALFTREFFANVRRVLQPGGRFFQWVQLYGLDPVGVGAILGGLHEQFPYVYGFTPQAGDPDLLLLATDHPFQKSDLPDWQALSEPVRNDLRRINIFSTADLWSLSRLLPADVEALARQAGRVNSDENMLIELRAPWSLHDAQAIQKNWDQLVRFHPDILSIADQGGRLDGDAVAALALAYASRREDSATARDLLRESVARGDGSTAAVAEVEVLLKEHPDQVDAAVRRLGEAIALAPAAFLPRLHRARLLVAADRYSEALEDVDVALRAMPGDLRARYIRLQIFGALGRGREAREEAEALLASPYAQLEPQVWAYAARAAAMQGRFDQAIPEMRRYLEWNPTSIEWPTLAKMYEGAGQREPAAAARRNAERAERNRVLATHQIARRLAALGDREQAISLLREALRSDPAYQPARDDLRQLGVRE